MYKCEYCKYETPRKNGLDRHIKSCSSFLTSKTEEELNSKTITIKKQAMIIKKQAEEIKKQKEEITKLKTDIKIASRDGKIEVYSQLPIGNTKIKNNTVYNTVQQRLESLKYDTIAPMNVDTVREAINRGEYTRELYFKGSYGVAEFLLNIMVKDGEQNYACTNTKEGSFHRLEIGKIWNGDKRAAYLHNCLDELYEPAKVHYLQINVDYGNPNIPRDARDALMEKNMKVKPSFYGLEGKKTSKERIALFNEVVRYITPHVNAPTAGVNNDIKMIEDRDDEGDQQKCKIAEIAEID